MSFEKSSILRWINCGIQLQFTNIQCKMVQKVQQTPIAYCLIMHILIWNASIRHIPNSWRYEDANVIIHDRVSRRQDQTSTKIFHLFVLQFLTVKSQAFLSSSALMLGQCTYRFTFIENYYRKSLLYEDFANSSYTKLCSKSENWANDLLCRCSNHQLFIVVLCSFIIHHIGNLIS